jgi:hypothetical protein
MRRYEVVVRPRAKHRTVKLREVSAAHIGKLVRVQARPASPPLAPAVAGLQAYMWAQGPCRQRRGGRPGRLRGRAAPAAGARRGRLRSQPRARACRAS